MIEMGFDYAHAQLALKSTNFENIDRAISFLIEKNPSTNKYDHPFINFGQANLC
jgi:hypothetical protein